MLIMVIKKYYLLFNKFLPWANFDFQQDDDM